VVGFNVVIVTYTQVAHFVIPTLESNRPEHQRLGIEVFAKLYSIPLVRSTVEIWAKQHEKIRFGAFCKATIFHTRYLMDRFQQRRNSALKAAGQEREPDKQNEETSTNTRPYSINYLALGEKLAQMWILMPPDSKEKLVNKT
jgi:hypothetical protein